MKTIPSILLIISLVAYSPVVWGAFESEPAQKEPFSWSQFWQDFKKDWIKVGHEAKDAGTEAGRTIKKEFQELPGNVREGFKKAKEDLKGTPGKSEDSSSDQ